MYRKFIPGLWTKHISSHLYHSLWSITGFQTAVTNSVLDLRWTLGVNKQWILFGNAVKSVPNVHLCGLVQMCHLYRLVHRLVHRGQSNGVWFFYSFYYIQKATQVYNGSVCHTAKTLIKCRWTPQTSGRKKNIHSKQSNTHNQIFILTQDMGEEPSL